MPLLSGIGKLRAAGKSGYGKNLSRLAIGAGIATGLSRENVAETSFDYMNEVLLGDPEADRAMLGRDIGWSAFVNPMGNPATAAMTGMVGGAGVGAYAGFKAGGVAGAVGGGLLGGLLGGTASAISTTVPYLNSTIIGDAFNDDAGQAAAQQMAEKNIYKNQGINRYDVPNSMSAYDAVVERQGRARNEDYYGYDFPSARSSGGRSNGASGDIVLGMYNMRMG